MRTLAIGITQGVNPKLTDNKGSRVQIVGDNDKILPVSPEQSAEICWDIVFDNPL